MNEEHSKGFHDARPIPHPDSDEAKRRADKAHKETLDMNATVSKEEAIRRADLDRDIAAAVTTVDKGILSEETMHKTARQATNDHRETFTIPHGCVPVQDGEGKATGGFVIATIADKLPGYTPIRDDKNVLIAVRQTATPTAAFEKLNSALADAIDPPLFQMDVPGYEPLRRVLEEAYNQSARGKGRQRHANEKPFLRQPIMEICRMVGLGGQTYQIIKKAQEATTLDSRGQRGAAKAELLGVIVYAAAAFLLIEESE